MKKIYINPMGTHTSFDIPYDILFRAWKKVCKNIGGGLYHENELPEMLDRTIRGCARDVDYEIAKRFGGRKISERKLLKIVYRTYQEFVLGEIEDALYKYRCE